MSGWTGKDIAALVAVGLTIISFAIGYGVVTERVAGLEKRTDLSDDVAAMKTQLGNLDKQLDRIERKLDRSTP